MACVLELGASILSICGRVRVLLVCKGRRCAGVDVTLYLYYLQVEGDKEGAGKGKLLLYRRVRVPQALDGENVEEDGGQLDANRQKEVVDVAYARHVGGELLAVLHVHIE